MHARGNAAERQPWPLGEGGRPPTSRESIRMTWDTNIFIAEVFGTGLLVLLGDAVVAGVLLAKSKSQNAGWIVITAAWAGAVIGAILVTIHYWDHFKETEDQGLKLAVYSTGPNIRNYGLNFVSEVIGTFVLVFVIFAFGTNGTVDGMQPGLGGFAALGALPVAVLVWSIGMSLGGTTGYAINPARDLGTRIIHAILPIPGKGSSDWGYAWVPVAGPIIGGVLAAIVYVGVWTNYMGM